MESGNWFLRSKEYVAWRDLDADSHLWLYGKVGCSKTALCSTIIEDLRGNAHQERTAVVYFYFNFRDTSKQTYHALLCSILLQLCTYPLARQELMRVFSEERSEQISTTEADQLIRALLAAFDRVYLIIDALDECPKPIERRELLASLVCLVASPHLRCLVSSRPEADIDQALGPSTFQGYALSSDDINKDIRLWLEGRFRDEDKFTTDFENLISSTILTRADGMSVRLWPCT